MGEIRDRLLKLAEQEGKSVRSFEIRCQINPGTIANCRAGLNTKNLEKIMLAYPEADYYYIVTGKVDPKFSDPAMRNRKVEDLFSMANETTEELKNRVIELEKEKVKLLEEIKEEKERLIRYLLRDNSQLIDNL